MFMYRGSRLDAANRLGRIDYEVRFQFASCWTQRRTVSTPPEGFEWRRPRASTLIRLQRYRKQYSFEMHLGDRSLFSAT
jgi:hypothetical protein